MLRQPLSPAFAFLFFCFSLVIQQAQACEGTAFPPCGRSIYLAKFSQQTLVKPAKKKSLSVPITVLPFVNWGLTNGCAQPTSASIDLTLTCNPTDGSAAVVIGPSNFLLPTPTTPGTQPLSAPLTVTVPKKTLKRGGPDYVCAISGEYDVTFGTGIGSGLLTGVGDTEVCIVDPSPFNKKFPRLDIELLTPESDQFPHGMFMRGDQNTNFYLISNNDKKSVDVTISSRQRQAAILPSGFDTADEAFDANAFSTSLFTPMTDTFPGQFTNLLQPGSMLIPLPDATEPTDGLIQGSVTLKPRQIAILPIDFRSFGMCADGSCGENTVFLNGVYQGRRNRDAIACASRAVVVDSSLPGITPLTRFTDDIKVHPNDLVAFSPAFFGDNDGFFDNLSTHPAGNIDPSISSSAGTQLTGENLLTGSPTDPPSSSSDFLRTALEPEGFAYSLNINDQVINFVSVDGLPMLGDGNLFEIPAVIPSPFAQESYNIFYDGNIDQLTITDSGETQQFQGPLSTFLETPPAGLLPIPETCRSITRTDPSSTKTAFTAPRAIARLFTGRSKKKLNKAINQAMESITIKTDPEMTGTWSASVIGTGVTLVNSTGSLGDSDPLMVKFIPGQTSNSPNISIASIAITVPGALNSPIIFPVATRKVPPPRRRRK